MSEEIIDAKEKNRKAGNWWRSPRLIVLISSSEAGAPELSAESATSKQGRRGRGNANKEMHDGLMVFDR